MSASNKKSWVLVAIGGAAALAAVAYGVRWIGQQQTRKVATAQVDEWQRGWSAARACLVGDESTFSSAGNAYLMYEATHPNELGRERGCEPLIRKLKRPGSESTGVATIENSWNDIREATKQLSNAFVGVIDQSTYSPMGPRRARLAEALDAMDAAHAHLRQESGMSALPARGTMAPPSELPEGIRPPGVDFPVHTLEVAGGALVLHGYLGDHQVRAVVRGTDQVARHAYVALNDLQLAMDDVPWAAWSSTDEQQRRHLYTADLSATGAPGEPSAIAYSAPGEAYALNVRFALGQGDIRTVFFDRMGFGSGRSQDSLESGLFAVRSTDRGATWSAPVAIAAFSVVARADYGGRQIDLIKLEPDGSVRWLPLGVAALEATPRPRRLYEATVLDPLAGCTHGAIGWWLRDMSALYRVDDQGGARPVELSTDGVSLVGCTDKQALLSSFTEAGVILHVCDARACGQTRTLPQASQARYALGMSQETGPVGVTQTNRLILAWRGDQPVRAYLVRPEDELRALVIWDGVVHLVVTDTVQGDLRLIPLP